MASEEAEHRAHYVAIITDGNGRWARQRGLPELAGHEAGADTVKARLRDAVDLGIQELTLYSRKLHAAAPTPSARRQSIRRTAAATRP